MTWQAGIAVVVLLFVALWVFLLIQEARDWWQGRGED